MSTDFMMEDQKSIWTERVLIKYTGESEQVIVPEEVEVIGEEAFAGCESVKTIVLPEKLTSIGRGAFRDCKNLEKINFPARLRWLDDEAFRGCASLTTIELSGPEIPGPESLSISRKSSLGQAVLSLCGEKCTPVVTTIYCTKHTEVRDYALVVDPWTGDSWMATEGIDYSEYEVYPAGEKETIFHSDYLYMTEEEALRSLKNDKGVPHGLEMEILGQLCFGEHVFLFIDLVRHLDKPYQIQALIRHKDGNPNIYKRINRAELFFLYWMTVPESLM